MSASVRDGASSPKDTEHTGIQHDTKEQITSNPSGANYKGFVAGVFSGIAKLSVG
jgi:solute carrier family 25 carnitine/acylcarnitine transporter 20/29